MVKQLQPHTLVHLAGINDTTWAGNELGTSPETVWKVASVAGFPYWDPREGDASVRTFKWFWNSTTEGQQVSVSDPLSMMHQSIGYGTNLLLNIPIDRRGLMPAQDAHEVIQAGRIWQRNYNTARNLAYNKPVTASSSHDVWDFQKVVYNASHITDGDSNTFWMALNTQTPFNGEDFPTSDDIIEINLGTSARFDRVMMEEMITRGQRVESYAIENWNGSDWKLIAQGTKIGHKKISSFPVDRLARRC